MCISIYLPDDDFVEVETCSIHIIDKLLLLLLLYSLSPLCRVFTIIYLKQTMFVGYTVCSSCFVFTIYTACNVISQVKRFVLLHYCSPKYVRSVNRGCFCSCFPGMFLRCLLNNFEIVTVPPIISGLTSVFIFHMRFIYILRGLLLLLLLFIDCAVCWIKCCTNAKTHSTIIHSNSFSLPYGPEIDMARNKA